MVLKDILSISVVAYRNFPKPINFIKGSAVKKCPIYSTLSRHFSKAVSRTGFTDYEKERKKTFIVPKYYNFARDVIDKWAAKEKNGERKNNPAFWFVWENGNELKWTFQELSEHSRRTANVLKEMCKLKRGDIVMVVLPKVPEWWLINLAAIRTGVVLCPGTIQLTKKDLEYRLSSLQPTCIFTDEEKAEDFEKVLHICPSLKTKVIVSATKCIRSGWLNFHELQERVSSNHECINTTSNESLTIFFTSGTTGPPKMIEHSHGSYGYDHFITGRYWMDLTHNDTIWNISDTGWAKSAYSNLYAPWIQGACVFVHEMKRFQPILTLQILQQYPITTFCVPPTAYKMLLHQDIKSFHFPFLEQCLSAGEPLNPEVIEKWREATGLLIYEGYGQTETILTCAMFRCIKYKPGSMGKPSPGIDLRILDGNGEEVKTGQVGEIAVKLKPNFPPGMFKGYKGSSESWENILDKTYHLTGDLAYRDEDGYFWFVSRADDVILTSGYRIGPFEVESAIMTHPSVFEVAVISSPDPERGEVVKAFIVLKPEYNICDKGQLVEEIQNHVKSVTAPYKYPRKIEFVEDLPKTVSGKIQRVLLKNKEWNRT